MKACTKLLSKSWFWELFSSKYTFHETYFFRFSIHPYIPNNAFLYDPLKEISLTT